MCIIGLKAIAVMQLLVLGNLGIVLGNLGKEI